MNPDERIRPIAVLEGLAVADRQSLATLIAIYEDAKLITLVSSRVKDAIDQVSKVVDGLYEQSVDEMQKAFAVRLNQLTERIVASRLCDENLRVALWAHLCEGLQLEPALSLSTRGLQLIAVNVVSSASLVFKEQLARERRAAQSLMNASYWRDLLRELNPFASTSDEFIPFEFVVRTTAIRMIGAALQNNNLPADMRSDITERVRRSVSELDARSRARLLNQVGAEELGNEAIAKLLIGGGGLIGTALAVELAGFSAYILAAQASALIPLVSGKALVSGLFVLTHPFFVVPALLGGAYLVSGRLQRSIRKDLSSSVAAILALQGVGSRKTPAGRGMLDIFEHFETYVAPFVAGSAVEGRNRTSAGRVDSPLSGTSLRLRPPRLDEYREIRRAFARRARPPKGTSRNLASELDRPLGGKAGDRLAELLFGDPPSRSKDTAALAGLTLGDLLYDAAAIDPAVVAAADFARVEGIRSDLAFSPFAERTCELSGAALEGSTANLRGYAAERMVAVGLVEQGHVVSFPETSNQAGFDLLVDGHPFQIKCLDGIGGLREHFDRYPDIPVLANAELAEKIADRSESWTDLVFFTEGYSLSSVSEMVDRSLKAGSELADYEIPLFAAAMSAARNLYGWRKGQVPLEDIAWNIALDSAAKGTLGIAGGFMGKGIGLLLFGPAGGVVVGGVAAVVATAQSGPLVDKIDKGLDPERDGDLDHAARTLLRDCAVQLENKESLFLGKRQQLAEGPLFAYIAARFDDEIAFIQERRCEIFRLEQLTNISGEQRAALALGTAQRSGVHPIWLQKTYRELLRLQLVPKRRIEGLIKHVQSWTGRARGANSTAKPVGR